MFSDRDYIRRHYNDDGRPSSWILPILILNGIVFLFTSMHPGSNVIREHFLLHSYYIRHWQLWRLVTYQFVHADLWHLICNMWGLYLFGRLVEQVLGPRRFLALYLISGIIGGMTWLLFNWGGPIAVQVLVDDIPKAGILSAAELDSLLKTQSVTLLRLGGGVIGASGSIFGVMTATAMLFPTMQVQLLFPPIPMKMRTMLIIYMAIEIFSLHSQGSVAHLAHLGGALGGFLFLKKEYYGNLFRKLSFERKRSRFTPEGESRRNMPPSAEEQEIIRILHKMSTLGYNKLTDEEKRRLEEANDSQAYRKF